MLLQKDSSNIILKFNHRFYSLNAIIGANTIFQDFFSSQVEFAVLNMGRSLYHKVTLTPKSKLDLSKVTAYVNEVLAQELKIIKK